jgi:glutamine amidotransferase
MIGVLNYGMGNLSSVTNALDYLGIDNQIINSKEEFSDISKLIIPGVGAYAQAMENMRNAQFIDVIREFGISGNPILGICLGMQLLSSFGNESYRTEGLGLIEGEVMELPKDLGKRIPHVGWNGIHVVNDHPILEGVKLKADFYFVHSFYFGNITNGNIIANTDYGIHFPSMVCNNGRNIVGIQFHPEKSQKQGLQILENFSNFSNA